MAEADWLGPLLARCSAITICQLQKEGDSYDLKIVANSAAPNIPTTGDLKLL